MPPFPFPPPSPFLLVRPFFLQVVPQSPLCISICLSHYSSSSSFSSFSSSSSFLLSPSSPHPHSPSSHLRRMTSTESPSMSVAPLTLSSSSFNPSSPSSSFSSSPSHSLSSPSPSDSPSPSSVHGPIGLQLSSLLQNSFSAPSSSFEILNESSGHNVPKGSESHFRVVIISDDFMGKSLIERHRMVNNIVKSNGLFTHIHALSIVAKTKEEWEKKGGSGIGKSPPCLGGMKREMHQQKEKEKEQENLDGK